MATSSEPAAPSAQELIEHLPLPGVILRGDGSVQFENDLAQRRIPTTWLAGAGSALVRLASDGQTRVRDVCQPEGGCEPFTAYAAGLEGQTVVLFEDRATAGAAHAVALQQRIAELEKLSVTDRLTGLWNRRHFDAVVERELAFSERERSPLSLLLFDLDHFKAVNDNHGHAAGDEVLRATAARLRQGSRPADLVFRWGGEEFALLAPATTLRAATALAERVRAALAAEAFPVAGHLTLSAGVAEHLADESAAAWFARLDAALYQAKERGRNRVVAAAGGASAAWDAQAGSSALCLVWSERCESGHALIDAEHRGLFDATNALIAAMTDQPLRSPALLAQVDGLLAAVARHFADEERVLEAARYPALHAHRQLHAKLLAAARGLRDSMAAGAASAGDAVEFLAYEVVNRHILKADRAFFPWVAPG